MSARIRHHIRSNVIGYMALFVALSGTAYAVDGPLPGQNQVGSADIINNEVQTADIKDANLTTADIRSGAVTTGKVLDDTLPGGGLSAADLAAGSVGSSELQTNAIPANGFGDDGSTKLGDNSVNFNELAPDAVESLKVEDDSLIGADIDESTLTGVNADKVDGGDLCRTPGTLSLIINAPASTVCTSGSLSLIATCTGSEPTDGTQASLILLSTANDTFVSSEGSADPDLDTADPPAVLLQAAAPGGDPSVAEATAASGGTFAAGNVDGSQLAGSAAVRGTNDWIPPGFPNESHCEFVVGATD
jgi:hypothetical protein